MTTSKGDPVIKPYAACVVCNAYLARRADAVTATGKTMHVKRCCNGCGSDVGDVNDAELHAAMAGQPLPDVQLECGCLTDDSGTAA